MDKTEQSDRQEEVGEGPTATPGLGRWQKALIAGVGFTGLIGFLAGIRAVLVNSNAAGTVTLLALSTVLVLVGTNGVAPHLIERISKSIESSGSTKHGPYIVPEAFAYWAKANVQMLISIIAVGFLLVRLLNALDNDSFSSTDIFELIAYALAVAAVLELAYTLFTPGPDEALDPLVLGLSALLLLQFEKIGALEHLEALDYRAAIAILLYVLALGALFGIRQWWSRNEELEELRRIRAAKRKDSPNTPA